jgi:hypothetical protein
MIDKLEFIIALASERHFGHLENPNSSAKSKNARRKIAIH